MADSGDRIATLIGTEVDEPVAPAFLALAEAARRRHEAAALAVLFYGSCLRSGEDRDQIADLYLIVEGYRTAYRNPLLPLANRLLPPNVFYLETPFEGRTLRAKYAVLSLTAFERLVTGRTLQPYFWARFAQPVRLLWARDGTSRARTVGALAAAVQTTLRETRPLLDPPAGGPGTAELFVRAFEESYRTELRSERAGRAAELVRTDPERYARLAGALAEPEGDPAGRAPAARRRAEARWRRRRLAGKGLSVLRLAKAAFTFTDGAAYLLWKIERHSGVRQELTPWQRRHPILASPALFWRLYRRGAFR